jgi:hypothetical protein
MLDAWFVIVSIWLPKKTIRQSILFMYSYVFKYFYPFYILVINYGVISFINGKESLFWFRCYML